MTLSLGLLTFAEEATSGPSKGLLLLTVFLLAIYVGVEIITKIPPTLHTPLMSGSNAISGITMVGALLSLQADHPTLGKTLGCAAVILTIAYVIRKRVGFWLHRPPEDDGSSEDEH